MNRKVAVVGGAGNVGATVAHAIAAKELADVVIIDIAEQKAAGMALDMYEACPIEKSDARVIGGGDWAEASGADIVVITSGKPRKPGMSRDDLVRDNFAIMESIAPNLVKHCPNAIVIPVANPLDAMAQALLKLSKFPRERIIGMAGVLDSARMRTFIAMELNVSVENVHAFVLGGHGDSMVAMVNHTKINGKPLTALVNDGKIKNDKLQSIIERTQKGGAEIVKFLEKGSAFYAPAASGVEMAESYLKDFKKTLPCAAYLNGEYGINNLYAGVPVIIGKNGVEKVIEINLSGEEKKQFDNSIKSVKELFEVAKKIDNSLN